jgi:hypothetical protein
MGRPLQRASNLSTVYERRTVQFPRRFLYGVPRDILIYSEDPLEHDLHVRRVLDRLREAGLQADIKEIGV